MNFINQAKEMYSDYQAQQGGQQNAGNHQEGSDFGITGGSRFNSETNRPPSYNNGPDPDAAVSQASNFAGDAGDESLFAKAAAFVKGQNHEDSIDEEKVVDAHREAYEKGNAGNMDASSIGMAAAMQAFKKFTQKEDAPAPQAAGSSNTLISMAMSEAAKLFSSSGGAASGNKQDAVNSASSMILKLIVQSKMQTMMGGSNSGGLSGLMGMASKFL